MSMGPLETMKLSAERKCRGWHDLDRTPVGGAEEPEQVPAECEVQVGMLGGGCTELGWAGSIGTWGPVSRQATNLDHTQEDRTGRNGTLPKGRG